jgi:acetyl esterase/lipase
VALYSKYDESLNNPAQPIAKDALEYLRKDLAKVPAGTPVVVATHLCFDAITNRDEFIDAFGDANVILVLGGHYHKATVNKYRGVNFVQLPSPAPDSAREVTVIRIDSKRLVTIPFDYEKGQWCTDPKKILDTSVAAPEVKTMTYKTVGDRELKIHVHYPPGWKASDARPAIIFFFGGGWTSGKIEQFQPQAEYFASRGLVAARADYRVKSRDGVTPDKCVEDARSAVRWMRQYAKELGIDPQKLIASGGSAGGHLAACTMIAKCVEAEGDDLSISTIPQAMVLFNPVLSFDHEQMIERINGDKELARKISPTLHLDKNSPPALILFGTKDRLKVFGDEYWKKAETLGVRADKYLAEGQGHGFFNNSPWRERTIIAADKFLTSLGFLKGEPTIKAPDDNEGDKP